MTALRPLLALVVSLLAASPALANFHGLLSAARLDDLALARQLLAEGSPPDGDAVGFPDSYTPLMFAARHGNGDLIALLLAAGAEVDNRDHNGDRALIWAAQAGQPQSARLLLAAGAAPQSPHDPYGITPLMKAAGGRSLETVQVLLKEGADVTLRDHSGRTALHYAAVWGSAEILERLLGEPGTDPNLIDEGLRETPLHIAAHRGQEEKVAALLRAGANSETRTTSGMTALLLSAWIGSADTVSALLSGGADPAARDAYGATALLLAIRSGSAETVAELLPHSDRDATDAAGQGIEHYLATVRTSLSTHVVPEGSRAAAREPDWDAIARDIAEKQAAIRLVLGLPPA